MRFTRHAFSDSSGARIGIDRLWFNHGALGRHQAPKAIAAGAVWPGSALWHGGCLRPPNAMGKITALHASDESEFCVIGDHVYLKLGHAELVDVVDALHRSRKLALERRLLGILRTMPVARDSAGHADRSQFSRN
jgi:hypothetical protein